MGGIVGDLFDFDFPLVVCLDDTFDEGGGGHAIGQLADGDEVFVQFFEAGTGFDAPAPAPVLIIGHIDHASGGEIGVDGDLLAFEEGDGSQDELYEVVGQDFSGKPYGDPFCPLCEEQGELHGQGERFPFSTVIGELPFRSLGVEGHFEGEAGEAGLNVAGRGGAVAGEDIPPVALGIYQEVFLAEVDQGIADRSVAVGVVLHGLSDDIGYFVVAAIVHFLHRVKDAALYRLEPVLYGRDGAFQDNVGGVVQEVILVHPLEGEQSVCCFVVYFAHTGSCSLFASNI